MLVALLLVLFSALSTQMRIRWRIGLLILAALAFFASALSGTRSSVLALAVLGGMLVFLTKDRFHRRLLGWGVVALVLGVVLMMGSGKLQEKMRVTEAMKDLAHAESGNYQNSLGTRLILWGFAWDLFKENPWIGLGRDAYQQELTRAVEAGEVARTDRMHNHAHSDGLNAMATGGVVGLLSYLGIIVGPLVFFGRALRRAGSDTHQRLHAAAGVLVVGAFICFGLVNTNMDRPIPGLVYPLLICALAAQLLPLTRYTGKDDSV
jgi:O-antigen ligase